MRFLYQQTYRSPLKLHSLKFIQQRHSLHISSFETFYTPENDIEVPKTHVIHRKLSGARMFILNRPDKLNAINLGMIRNISPQLKAWDVSKLAKVIIMKGINEGKFSVGDDVLEIVQKVNAKDPDSLYYFQEKSALIQMISTLTTPYVSILDGYALGGALGLYAHGPFRIATEKTIFAMPEPTLGVLFNAGSSFYLPKLDGEIGTYLALTGTRLEGLDTFYAGIATHYVPSSRLTALEDRLVDLETSEHEIIQKVLEKFVEPIPANRIGFQQNIRESIDRCFKYDTIEEIIQALDNEKQTSWTRETKHKLLSMSPTSLRVTLKTLRKSKNKSLIDCLKLEFDLIQKFLVTKDFHEGVEGILLNKPRRKPNWDPSTLKDITDDDIERLYFTLPSPNALALPSTMDLYKYPYARFALPTEEDVRLAITGDGGNDIASEENNNNNNNNDNNDIDNSNNNNDNRLLTAQDVVSWFEKGHKGKIGVKEKVMDILERKTFKNSKQELEWKS